MYRWSSTSLTTSAAPAAPVAAPVATAVAAEGTVEEGGGAAAAVAAFVLVPPKDTVITGAVFSAVCRCGLPVVAFSPENVGLSCRSAALFATLLVAPAPPTPPPPPPGPGLANASTAIMDDNPPVGGSASDADAGRRGDTFSTGTSCGAANVAATSAGRCPTDDAPW
jgi:hypothetical protein